MVAALSIVSVRDMVAANGPEYVLSADKVGNSLCGVRKQGETGQLALVAAESRVPLQFWKVGKHNSLISCVRNLRCILK